MERAPAMEKFLHRAVRAGGALFFSSLSGPSIGSNSPMEEPLPPPPIAPEDTAPDVDERLRTVDERFSTRINVTVPDRHSPKLRRVMEVVNADDDLYTLWLATNVMAV